jgi:hypothetical protein
MLASGRKRLLRGLAIGGLGWVCLVAGGCARWNPRGPGFGDESSHWAEHLRPGSAAGQQFGFDQRTREIEANLGIR